MYSHEYDGPIPAVLQDIMDAQDQEDDFRLRAVVDSRGRITLANEDDDVLFLEENDTAHSDLGVEEDDNLLRQSRPERDGGETYLRCGKDELIIPDRLLYELKRYE